MKIKNSNGIVDFIMKAGKDLVKATMELSEAEKIIKNGEMKKTTAVKGYNVCVDGKYYFNTEKENESE